MHLYHVTNSGAASDVSISCGLGGLYIVSFQSVSGSYLGDDENNFQFKILILVVSVEPETGQNWLVDFQE